MIFSKKLIAILALLPGLALAASGGHPLDKAPERASLSSLQNGAKLFVNYCLNCHSASSMRYNRLRDLGLIGEGVRAVAQLDRLPVEVGVAVADDAADLEPVEQHVG